MNKKEIVIWQERVIREKSSKDWYRVEEIKFIKQIPEIIHENFFNYLRLSKISFRKYADDNNLDRTIISKWKNGSSKMTVEQIYQASEYFKITVNELFSESNIKRQEKLMKAKKIKELLEGKIQDNSISYLVNFDSFGGIFVQETDLSDYDHRIEDEKKVLNARIEELEAWVEEMQAELEMYEHEIF